MKIGCFVMWSHSGSINLGNASQEVGSDAQCSVSPTCAACSPPRLQMMDGTSASLPLSLILVSFHWVQLSAANTSFSPVNTNVWEPSMGHSAQQHRTKGGVPRL